MVAYRPLIRELGLDWTRKHFSAEELQGAAALRPILAAASVKRMKQESLTRSETEAENVSARLELLTKLQSGAAFSLVPPAPSAPPGSPWLPPLPSLIVEAHGPDLSARILSGFSALAQLGSDVTAWSALPNVLREANPSAYPASWRLQLEAAYARLPLFGWAGWLALVGFLSLLLVSRLAPAQWPSRLGVTLAIGALLLMTAGFGIRCLLAGRPPVTNMYESILWVAWGTSLLGLCFYAKHRAPLYLQAALPVTALCLFAVSLLPVEMPDRLDPLVPVLRDNFWLTIHVLTITLSYAAFALATGMGHIILYRTILRPTQTVSDRTLPFWLYRILMLGVLMLTVGTILGGIWANYSWGRFWGWDPKETWALIALLLYIFAIHGKIAGWWSDFGLALASVVCFAGVVMAWYGVNFVLGTGLHSYGFGLGGESYVTTFLCLELLFVGAAIWRFKQRTPLP